MRSHILSSFPPSRDDDRGNHAAGCATLSSLESRWISELLIAACRVGAVIWALVAWFYLALEIPALAGPVPDSWLIVVLWVLVALFAIATAMNGISRSRIERAIWTPVSAVLLVCALVNVFRALALSSLAG